MDSLRNPSITTSPTLGDTPTPVTGVTWKTHAMKNPATAIWNLGISSSEAAKLLQGFQPAAMEDRWMCRADGPDVHGNIVVHIYRSWTGQEHFRIKATAPVSDGTITEDRGGHGAKITEITWEQGDGPIQATEEDAKNLAIAVCRGVLKCELLQAV